MASIDPLKGVLSRQMPTMVHAVPASLVREIRPGFFLFSYSALTYDQWQVSAMGGSP
jgi:hypothetical protein